MQCFRRKKSTITLKCSFRTSLRFFCCSGNQFIVNGTCLHNQRLEKDKSKPIDVFDSASQNSVLQNPSAPPYNPYF